MFELATFKNWVQTEFFNVIFLRLFA